MSSSDTDRVDWRSELAEKDAATGEQAWYTKAITYWDAVPATVEGVLGGFGRVSPADVKDSDAYIRDALPEALAAARAGKRTLVAAGAWGS